jgi:uncharacterized protein
MPTEILLTGKNISLAGKLNDSPAGRALAAALPFEGQAHRWGDALSFPVPLALELDESAEVTVKVGDLAYRPSDRDLCIFFGLTPTSVPGEIRTDSAVMPVGWISGDPCCLGEVADGTLIRVEKKIG